ncbi:hypothetical protein LMH87_000716 [Akanthomyces muscarius]|uniref:glutathione transferase n=1 Tax=Akanthomyces muscarius TaxID=2231603 RepID=A0A9W8QHV9_AKAMU|nr:hypothetical protein LMH87_000716 [Akanthomyces muscarius]KAJ4155475.1 hypothetical protein LMH87_000716 [Akanthomyces muscarius]
MLTLHHLQRSQSERIVWLCEELGVEYELKTYPRDPKTMQCPPELQALHPTKAAPVIQDGGVTLAESGAIVEYILTKYGHGKLCISPEARNYADYLYFLHFGNGYFMPAVLGYAPYLRGTLVYSEGNLAAFFSNRSFKQALQILDDRLQTNKWLAGDEFTAADIMNVFVLTTVRLFVPYSLEGRDAILAYLERVTKREAYVRAMAKGDPGLAPVIAAKVATPGM